VATAQAYDGTRLVRLLDKAAPDFGDGRSGVPQEVRRKIRAVEGTDSFTSAVTKMKPRPYTPDNHESLGRDRASSPWRWQLVRAQ
jgi:hypothetical protein